MLLALVVVCLSQSGSQVEAVSNWTSITCLAAKDGVVYAGASGGLVRWRNRSKPEVFGRKQGLGSVRIRDLVSTRGEIVAFSDKAYVFSGGQFKPAPFEVSIQSARGGLSRYGSKMIKAIPGAGVVDDSGKPLRFGSPIPTTQVTAVAAEGNRLWIGTIDQGVWEYASGKWKQLRTPSPTLPVDDATALIPVNNTLWVAPRQGEAFALSDSNQTNRGKNWRSSVKWDGRTIIRRADGRLVDLDESGRERPFQYKLPRVYANSLAVSDKTLFVLQPGGWSEFRPGDEPRHEFGHISLAGIATTCILATQDQIFIGTQNAGLILYDRHRGTTNVLHETHGLTDDWVTALALDPKGNLLIGTFVGGLLKWDGKTLTHVGLHGENVTRLLRSDSCVWVGSLKGVYYWDAISLKRPSWAQEVEPDVYDLQTFQDRLWIAAGGSLFKVSQAR